MEEVGCVLPFPVAKGVVDETVLQCLYLSSGGCALIRSSKRVAVPWSSDESTH